MYICYFFPFKRRNAINKDYSLDYILKVIKERGIEGLRKKEKNIWNIFQDKSY